MDKPSILQGILVALLLTLLAAIASLVVYPLLGLSTGSLLIVYLLTLIYSSWLLYTSKSQAGKIVLVMINLGLLMVPVVFGISVISTIILAVGLIWINRSLLHYSSLISAGLDMLLIMFGLAAALWAFSYSDSLVMSVWCFFLSQALFVVIPAKFGKSRSIEGPGLSESHFAHAHRAAQAAVDAMVINK